MYYWGGNGWSWIGGLIMLLWWALVVLAIIWLIRYVVHNSGERVARGPEESALDILRKRYARGEIDRKEFEEKRKDLGE